MNTRRSFSHWTPRYVTDRVMQIWWMRQNPEAPWLSRQAVMFIDQWLKPDDYALEWGSGRSTTWFARRVRRLCSVEHDPGWYQSVNNLIVQQELKNVDYVLREQTGNGPSDAEEYSQGILRDIDDESLDFALVDGIFRDHCALAVLGKLKPGGLLVIDDSHRYIPSNSRSPFAIPCRGPCPTSRWGRFLAETRGWRRVWFSDGIHDDALFFKPRGRL